MLYMAVSFNDPLVQLGLFICAYIIVTGVCSYFGYSSDQYGIYMTFTAFMLSVIMILPDPINFGDTFNTIIEPAVGVTSTPVPSLYTDAASVASRGAKQVAKSAASANRKVNAAAAATATASTNLARGIAGVYTNLKNILPSFPSLHTTVGRNSAAAASLSGFTDTNNEVELKPINKNIDNSLARNDSNVTITKVSPQVHALLTDSQNIQPTSAKATPQAIELSNIISVNQ